MTDIYAHTLPGLMLSVAAEQATRGHIPGMSILIANYLAPGGDT